MRIACASELAEEQGQTEETRRCDADAGKDNGQRRQLDHCDADEEEGTAP